MNEISTDVKHDLIQGLQYWKNNKTLSEQVRHELIDANVLFVPMERYSKSTDPGTFFAPDAEPFFVFLKESGKDKVIADMCVNDGEYRKLALNSEPITLTVLGTIIVSSVVAPIIKDLILDFIRKKSGTNNNSEVRFKLVVDNEKGLIREIDYQGCSSEVEKALPQLIENCLLESRNGISQKSKNVDKQRNVTVDVDSVSIDDVE